jgi:peptide-methionine (S)-S-oxide reductase
MNAPDKKPFSIQPYVAPALAVLAVVALVPLSGIFPTASAEEAKVVPPAAHDEPLASAPGMETAVVAGGCFWGIQGVFQHVKGVTMAVSGYSGGDADTAHYQVVGTGMTGHAESVQITYDPSQISYGKLLQVFFSVALDPTQKDRQGPDVGTQYRSALFTANDTQAEIARDYIAQLDKAGVFDKPIATEVTPFKAFYAAEDYHQDYATLHPESGYIAYNDLPKIAALQALFPDLWREKPVLVNVAAKS